MTRMVEDCFSAHLDLMLLCPNGVLQDGVNTDKYLPNPRHVSPRAMAMFELVGRIMGCSLRLKMCLPFHFPSIVSAHCVPFHGRCCVAVCIIVLPCIFDVRQVWKLLVGQKVDVSDIDAIDTATAKVCVQIGVHGVHRADRRGGWMCAALVRRDSGYCLCLLAVVAGTAK